MINLSVGMLGSIMVASPEAMVVDDDMCGAILRSIRGIEVSAETLDLDAVERVVTQDGHYLGESESAHSWSLRVPTCLASANLCRCAWLRPSR